MTQAPPIPRALELRLQRNIHRFMLFRALTFLFLLSPIWVVYLQEERGLSLAQVTAMEGPFWLAMVAFEVPTGIVADRFGRRTSLLLGCVVNFVAIFIFAVAHNYPLLFASYIIWAIGLTLLSGADSAFFFDTLKALGREDEYQRLWGRVWALQIVASGVGILAGPPLAAITSLQVAIMANGFIFLVAALVGLTLVEPPLREAPRGIWDNTRTAARITWHSRPVRAMMAFTAVIVASAFATDVFVQPFLRQHEVDLALFGPLLLPGRLLSVAGALFAYRITSHLGLRRSAIFLVALTLSPLLLLSTIDHIGVFAAFPLLGGAAGMVNPVMSDYVNRRIPSAQRATVMSFSSLCFSLVLASMVPIAGAAGSHDLRLAFAVVGGFLAALGIPLMLMLFRADRGEADAAPEPREEPVLAAPPAS